MFELLEKLFGTRRILEAKLPDVQQQILNRISPSLEFTQSTWSSEEEWFKFLILNDGSTIPVKSSHMETIIGAKLDPEFVDKSGIIDQFDESGGIQGSVMVNDEDEYNMSLFAKKDPNDAQITSIIQIYKKYDVQGAFADIPHRFDLDIKSAEQLEAVLKYGPEMAMTPAEERKKSG